MPTACNYYDTRAPSGVHSAHTAQHYTAKENNDISKWLRYCVIGLLVLFAGNFLVTRAYTGVLKPYNEFLAKRRYEQEQSRVYLNDENGFCVGIEKANLRLQIPMYDKCREAKLALESSPEMDALTDYLQWIQICAPGQCFVWSMNIFSSLALFMWGAGLAVVLLGIAMCAGCTMLYWKSMQVRNSLPTTYDPIQHAAMFKQSMARDYLPSEYVNLDHVKQM